MSGKGWVGSYKGGVDHVGGRVRWVTVRVGWGGSCSAGVGWVGQYGVECSGSCRSGVGQGLLRWEGESCAVDHSVAVWYWWVMVG